MNDLCPELDEFDVRSCPLDGADGASNDFVGVSGVCRNGGDAEHTDLVLVLRLHLGDRDGELTLNLRDQGFHDRALRLERLRPGDSQDEPGGADYHARLASMKHRVEQGRPPTHRLGRRKGLSSRQLQGGHGKQAIAGADTKRAGYHALDVSRDPGADLDMRP